jgi:hypothetical protein
MKLAAFQELKEALETKRMNDENLDYLASSLRFILRYGQKYNIPIPESDKILDLINKLIAIENRNSPPKTKHPFSTPDDETEPKICMNTFTNKRNSIHMKIARKVVKVIISADTNCRSNCLRVGAS